jgi:hypothetical protein
MKQKYALCMLAIIISTALFCGCGKDNATAPEVAITVTPVLKITNTDYTSSANIGDTASVNHLTKAYESCYSDELKMDIFNYMHTQVALSGQDISSYEKCLNATGLPFSTEMLLLCYVEKAKYKGRDAWIIQNIKGFGPSRFLGYKVFVMDAVNADTLCWTQTK